MFPKQIVPDVSNHGTMNAVFLGKPAWGLGKLDLDDGLLCELRPSMQFPFALPVFLNFVILILCLSTKKEMTGLNAAWFVALMKNTKIVWYWSICCLPRHAVYAQGLTVKPNTTIPFTLEFCSKPYPTSCRREEITAAGKLFLNRYWFSHDTSTKAGDGVRVRSVVADRRSCAPVPAM